MFRLGEIKARAAEAQRLGIKQYTYKHTDVQWLIDQVEASAAAVGHLLRRIGEDPAGVGYHAGFASEVFERAVHAYAHYTDRSEGDVQEEILASQKFHRDDEQELHMLRRRIEGLETRS